MSEKTILDADRILKNCRKTAAVYSDAAAYAEEIVKNSCEVEDIPFALQIDIEVVAKYLGIEIRQSKLINNTGGKDNVIAIMSRQDGQDKILVDSHINYKTRRYAIAHAIAKTMLKKQEFIFSSTHAVQFVPHSFCELSADMLALFLLMPASLFKDELLSYMKRNSSLDLEPLLTYLSDVAQVPPYHLAVGYQNLKAVLYYRYQEEIKTSNDVEQKDPYEIIYA